MFLDLSPAEQVHLAVALNEQQRALRRNGQRLPARLVELADGLLRSAAASDGQHSPPAVETAQPDDALLIRAPEAARLLGLSSRTLRRLTAAGDVPSVRIGAIRRYRRHELEALITELPTGQDP